MLTKTSLAAIQLLALLARNGSRSPVSPRALARQLRASPTYLAKVAHLLVKADLLRAHRGARGGVVLSKQPDRIALLDVIEVCQGKILGDYCEGEASLDLVCAYHRAMLEVHEATTSVLNRWTVADIAAKPLPDESLHDRVECRMGCLAHTESVRK